MIFIGNIPDILTKEQILSKLTLHSIKLSKFKKKAKKSFMKIQLHIGQNINNQIQLLKKAFGKKYPNMVITKSLQKGLPLRTICVHCNKDGHWKN